MDTSGGTNFLNKIFLFRKIVRILTSCFVLPLLILLDVLVIVVETVTPLRPPSSLRFTMTAVLAILNAVVAQG